MLLPPWLQTVALCIFLILTIAPALYGVHMYALVLLTHRQRNAVRARQLELAERFCAAAKTDADWPIVTTQIPLFNELHVARRVILAAANMDYPRGRHEVQVLDDSTDATRAVVDQVVDELRRRGHQISVVRRTERQHFKAGALAAGLKAARGEFIAIFDADFVPQAEFLRRMIPLLASQPQVGCVQGRWGHLNENDSWMTQALALGMDGHFGVEQSARAWNGLLLNFNGTGGVWRRSAIEDPRVEGWQGDTLTEDLDLSYRAQLAGWRIEYVADEVCPAEIPADAGALKSQQRRWATGSIQTARKLLPALWRSSLSVVQKLEATLHLTQYSINVFMVLMVLLGRPLLWISGPERFGTFLWLSWILIGLAALAPSLAYVYARWSLGGGAVGLVGILKLMLLGMGLSLNNTVAVLAGLTQRGGEFVRTPKSGSRGAPAKTCVYRVSSSRLWLAEILLGTFAFAQWLIFLPADHYVGGTFLLLFAIGLINLGLASRPRRGARGTHDPASAEQLVASPLQTT